LGEINKLATAEMDAEYLRNLQIHSHEEKQKLRAEKIKEWEEETECVRDEILLLANKK